jgi:hypothetical protein
VKCRHVTGLGAIKRSRDQSLTATVKSASSRPSVFLRPWLLGAARTSAVSPPRPVGWRTDHVSNAQVGAATLPKIRMLLQPVNKARPFSDFVRSGSPAPPARPAHSMRRPSSSRSIGTTTDLATWRGQTPTARHGSTRGGPPRIGHSSRTSSSRPALRRISPKSSAARA